MIYLALYQKGAVRIYHGDLPCIKRGQYEHIMVTCLVSKGGSTNISWRPALYQKVAVSHLVGAPFDHHLPLVGPGRARRRDIHVCL